MVDQTEEEQIEAIKKWWDENGTSLLTGLIVVFGGMFGYQAWENSVRETGEAASGLYEDLIEASNNAVPGTADDPMASTAKNLADTLKTEYGDTTYAQFASMHMAKLAVEANDLDTAIAEFRWVLEQNPDQELAALVKMRLARVLLANDDADAALSTMDGDAPAFSQLSSWEEVKGDIYLAMGDHGKARDAYQIALDNIDDEVSKPLLKVKLADIPVGGPVQTSDEPQAEEPEEEQ